MATKRLVFFNPLKFFSSVSISQVKLEEALTQATDFHNSLQDFINWLTQAEQTLNMVSPASLILETIMFQIDEHKVTPHSGKVLLTDDFLFTSCDCFASCCGSARTLEKCQHPAANVALFCSLACLRGGCNESTSSIRSTA